MRGGRPIRDRMLAVPTRCASRGLPESRKDPRQRRRARSYPFRTSARSASSAPDRRSCAYSCRFVWTYPARIPFSSQRGTSPTTRSATASCSSTVLGAYVVPLAVQMEPIGPQSLLCGPPDAPSFASVCLRRLVGSLGNREGNCFLIQVKKTATEVPARHLARVGGTAGSPFTRCGGSRARMWVSWR
jgi:hypothetical protein